MKSITEKYSAHTYAILRIVTGFLFFWHGTVKIFDFPIADPGKDAIYVTYIAGWIEVICAPLIAVGFLTRYAAFISCGLMAAAYFIVTLPNSWLPILSKGDLVVMYCFVLLHISAKGSGIWSIDAWRSKSL